MYYTWKELFTRFIVRWKERAVHSGYIICVFCLFVQVLLFVTSYFGFDEVLVLIVPGGGSGLRLNDGFDVKLEIVG